jgi:hypothetical protein
MPKTNPIHELALLFPPLPDSELGALAESIKAHGLRQPIVLLDGAVLDGRNRLAACEMAGIAPTFIEFTGDDPLAFVIDANLHRRHLSAGQKAAIASDIASRERGGDRKSAAYKNQSNDCYSDLSIDEAAARVDTNRMAVARFRQIEDAAPEIATEVRAGRMTLNAAGEKIKRAKGCATLQIDRHPAPERSAPDAPATAQHALLGWDNRYGALPEYQLDDDAREVVNDITMLMDTARSSVGSMTIFGIANKLHKNKSGDGCEFMEEQQAMATVRAAASMATMMSYFGEASLLALAYEAHKRLPAGALDGYLAELEEAAR